jgi:two-component system cell cycle response regulator DivK
VFQAIFAQQKAGSRRKLSNKGSLMNQAKQVFLVVEDFEDSRFMMRRLLEMAGYSVLVASDGEQAVEMAVQERPALILMDLSLPKLDGLAATRKIRQHKIVGKIPIVAVSAHDAPESRVEALEAGCDEYVTKPIDFDHLSAVVKRFLTKEDHSEQEIPTVAPKS